MPLMVSQKEYARLNRTTVARVTGWRKTGQLFGWKKLPNGRVYIPVDARTAFSRPGVEDTPERIREDFERRCSYVGYRRGTEYRKASREVLASAIHLTAQDIPSDRRK